MNTVGSKVGIAAVAMLIAMITHTSSVGEVFFAVLIVLSIAKFIKARKQSELIDAIISSFILLLPSKIVFGLALFFISISLVLKAAILITKLKMKRKDAF